MLRQEAPTSFVSIFQNIFGLNEVQIEILLSCFQLKTIRKKEFYIKEDEIVRTKAFTLKGCTRTFYLMSS
jgi:hypothetical protein